MTATERHNLVKTGARILFSLIFVCIGLWFVVQGGELRPIGTGFLGTIIGYWVK